MSLDDSFENRNVYIIRLIFSLKKIIKRVGILVREALVVLFVRDRRLMV